MITWRIAPFASKVKWFSISLVLNNKQNITWPLGETCWKIVHPFAALTSVWNIFQHSKINFVSPRGHIISSIFWKNFEASVNVVKHGFSCLTYLVRSTPKLRDAFMSGIRCNIYSNTYIGEHKCSPTDKNLKERISKSGLILHPGGAGSEAWDRVSMIAPVKKFGRARLSTGLREKETWRTSVSGKLL